MAATPSRFTETQVQYLAFIQAYALINGRPPAEADLQRFFGVTPAQRPQHDPRLERRQLSSRVPLQARSVAISVPEDELPRLRQPIKTTVTGD
jgi:hypothetical protein